MKASRSLRRIFQRPARNSAGSRPARMYPRTVRRWQSSRTAASVSPTSGAAAVTLIVANTVAMSARERVTEIAVMRTLGFRRSHILGFILSESVLMSLLGGLLGVVLAKYFFIPGMVKGMETSPMAPFMINFKVTWAVLAS